MPLSSLPTIPLFIFGILEPVLLIWGLTTALTDPTGFFTSQIPPQHTTTLTSLIPLPAQATVLTLQTGNIYLLLTGLALTCIWTSHGDISKKYLFVVAIADLGHIYAAYLGLGAEAFWDVGGWNDMVWGSVGVSAFLNVARWVTLVGGFGRVGGGGEGKGKRA